MKINKKRVLRAFYFPATHLIPLVYRRCGLTKSYGLPIAENASDEYKRRLASDSDCKPEIYPVGPQSPLWNSVVLCHLDIDKIIEIASIERLGSSVTREWLRDFKFDDSDPLEVVLLKNKAIYFHVAVENFTKAIKQIDDLRLMLLSEHRHRGIDLSWQGGNYTMFDGTKVEIFHYPK